MSLALRGRHVDSTNWRRDCETIRGFTLEAPLWHPLLQRTVGSVTMDYELSLSNCF